MEQKQEIELLECANCKTLFGLSDAEDFERFCSGLCEAEHKQEWAEFKNDELEHEAQMETLNDQEDIDDLE